MIKKLTLLSLLMAATAQAQVGTQLEWNQADADAQTLEYRLVVDGGQPATLPANCAISIPQPPVYACLANIPTSVAYGRHDFEVFACRLADGEEACSSGSVSGVYLEAPVNPSDVTVR